MVYGFEVYGMSMYNNKVNVLIMGYSLFEVNGVLFYSNIYIVCIYT